MTWAEFCKQWFDVAWEYRDRMFRAGLRGLRYVRW